MSKKVKWTRNAEIQLIQEVHERPILWDISHRQYNRSDLKAVYWDKVAEALGSQMTSNLAKERFENVRATFMRNERKIKDSTSSGKGADDIYRPKRDLYPLLTFLRKTIAQATSVSNLDVDADSAAMSIYSEASENVNIASSIYFDENLQKWVMIPKDTPITEAETVPSEPPPPCHLFQKYLNQVYHPRLVQVVYFLNLPPNLVDQLLLQQMHQILQQTQNAFLQQGVMICILNMAEKAAIIHL